MGVILPIGEQMKCLLLRKASDNYNVKVVPSATEEPINIALKALRIIAT